ncbi:serine hydrolase [Mucilaginibacter sp. UR6-11]|uniref:serine hydrolase n=1 Tax=Mucilaginibacter sp. UR6-11 TaxID=1435644 RepID=UPI001E5F3091|nr:serine hydrolase [Mucilaginibacter sp. UR6-11]MCC8425834.1 serine hydrolase [Mucilaginibacter sp. UR6-11]
MWAHADPETEGMSGVKLDAFKKALLTTGTKKILIIRNDKIICEGFAKGWADSVTTSGTASLAKALVSGMSLNAAIADGYINADAPACLYIPAWKKSDIKSKITIRQLDTHTSGLEDSEGTDEQEQQLIKQKKDRHMDLPGWKGQFWRKDPDPITLSRDSAKVLFKPGSSSGYSNPGIAMVNYAVTKSLQGSPYNNIASYLDQRIYSRIGIKKGTYSIGYKASYHVDGLDVIPGWGGAAFTADAVARIGRLVLKKGNWQGGQIIDSLVIKRALSFNGTAMPSVLNNIHSPTWDNRSSDNPVPVAALGWFTNYDGVFKSLPRDAFWGAGAGEQLLLVIPSLNIIVVRMGTTMYKDSDGSYWKFIENNIFDPVVDAVEAAPYPKSDFITAATFAPAKDVIRMAEGGDLWPSTWGDDGAMYTAYGDGNGFKPQTDIKLSSGLAVVSGTPPDLTGVNIRTPSGERVGEGPAGEKASGIIMVDGKLYLWMRNTGNARLACSADHGKTWVWADWKFDTSFGCPNFINYGKNNAGAKDDYVYTYSVDDASAYKYADQMVMARVNKNHIMDWAAYQFFAGYDSAGRPVWSEDIRKRKACYVNPGKTYRSGMTYDAPLKRYLWCQIIPLSGNKEEQGPRFKGGLGIFESRDPWGPWRTVFYARQWDMGPGESGSLPTNWMSKDGKSLYYLFSGNDSFSVRKLVLQTK